MSVDQLVPALNAPLSDICYNLAQVPNAAVQYLEVSARNAMPTGKLIRVVTEAHRYLDTHIDVLQDFKFTDSLYSLALYLQVCVIASHIPMDLWYPLWKKWYPLWKKWYLTDDEALCDEYALNDEALPPSKEGYETNREGCIIEADVWPFPFSVPGKKFLGVLLPPAGSALRGLNTCKWQQEQTVITETPVPVSNVHSEPVVGPSLSAKPMAQKAGPSAPVPSQPVVNPTPTGSMPHKAFRKSLAPNAYKVIQVTKKPHFSPSSESEVPESSDEGKVPSKPKEPLFLLSNNDPVSNKATPPPASSFQTCASTPK
ncbi:hypothetical protein EDD18DRAFT_1110107 [Armillaria luteobubalina]|uniref:Uncharacterized protein n=1 Tax=Armillaria luteobubalina TaxID=153913 RepID=A0AA39UHD6_9AGAR|nr:hypothetical protein EDD18DRAFT_1110107 [Armillaria luteobubalina]